MSPLAEPAGRRKGHRAHQGRAPSPHCSRAPDRPGTGRGPEVCGLHGTDGFWLAPFLHFERGEGVDNVFGPRFHVFHDHTFSRFHV